MKLTVDRPFANPEKAARRLMVHARAFQPVQDGRIYIENINGPFLFEDKGTPAEYAAEIRSFHKELRKLVVERKLTID